LDIDLIQGVAFSKVMKLIWVVVEAINKVPSLELKFPAGNQISRRPSATRTNSKIIQGEEFGRVGQRYWLYHTFSSSIIPVLSQNQYKYDDKTRQKTFPRTLKYSKIYKKIRFLGV
jgi:hypothetical protein